MPYEDAACCGDAVGHSPRIVHGDDEVLRSVGVGKGNHGVDVVKYHDAAVGKRACGDIGTGQQSELTRYLGVDLLGKFLTAAYEQRLAVGAVLGLGEEVGRHEVGTGAVVGHDHHFGRACGHVDGGALCTDHLLGLGHVAVAGAENLEHALNALGAVGHGGNGLCATQFIYGAYATLLGSVEHYGIYLASGAVAWGAKHNLLAASDLGGKCQHQNGREEWGAATWYVETYAAYGEHAATAVHTGHGVDIYGRSLLRLVKSADIACCLADSRLEFVAHHGLGFGKLGLRYLQRLGATSINLCGDGTQGLVTSLADALKDGAYTLFDDRVVIGGTQHQGGPGILIGGNIGL